MPQIMKDITGKTFGRLTAVKRHGVDPKGNVMWLCRCECGLSSIVRGTSLRNGGVKSCGGKGRGCMQNARRDITGMRFGRLIAISKAGFGLYGKDRQRIYKWKCQCDCGKTPTVLRSALVSGETQSCGCLARERRLAASTTHGKTKSLEYRLCGGGKGRARKLGLPCDIDYLDVVIPSHCPLLGIPLIAGKKVMTNNSPTLDRIVPENGYVKGNIWVISQKANRMKQDFTVAQLLHFAKVISEKLAQEPGSTPQLLL